eukprot:3059851-Rhodomonas_salina.4
MFLWALASAQDVQCWCGLNATRSEIQLIYDQLTSYCQTRQDTITMASTFKSYLKGCPGHFCSSLLRDCIFQDAQTAEYGGAWRQPFAETFLWTSIGTMDEAIAAGRAMSSFGTMELVLQCEQCSLQAEERICLTTATGC